MRDDLALLRSMMLIRAFETTLASRPDHGFQLLSSGEEAVAVGLCAALTRNDQLLTGGRSIGAALARGLDPGRVMAELLGKATGTNRGKGGRGHLADPASGFFGAHAVVAGNLSIAAGVALARQLSGEPGIVAVMFGDGATGAGSLHEVLNIAAVWKLPLLLICNNNQLSVSTPRTAVLAPKNLSDLALAYGIPARTTDGMDLDAVIEAVDASIAIVRAGFGPAFLECISFRFASHSTTARETRSRAELAEIKSRCPIGHYAAMLTGRGMLDKTAQTELEFEVQETVSSALAFAETSSYPEPEEAITDVW
jgi:TPP-dependent pyruvate/acetoin dehydrogenase alpha subunit